MQLVQRRQKPGHFVNGLIENFFVVVVRHEIAAVEHVNPQLAVADDFGAERLFHDVLGSDLSQCDSAVNSR